MELLAFILLFPFILLFVGFSWYVRGWAICKLSGWFLVPLGFPTISLWNTVGISILIGIMTKNYHKVSGKKESPLITLINVGMPLFGSLVAVFCGWIIHTYLQ